jgi:NADH-quinone oxidoreductase subunit H
MQYFGYNNILLLMFIPVLAILVLCFCIETGRTPLDFGESESELVAGYITELSGFFFTLFYLGEYFHLLVLSNSYSIIFIGFL